MNYIISSIQYDSLVNRPLLKNMLKFADEHKVDKIYLFVMPGKTVYEEGISQVLVDDDRIELLYLGKEGMKLNNNFKLHDSGILASQINPLTGFKKKLHRDFSYLLPSPKIRFDPAANTSSHPRFLATTGALTHGNYKMHTAQGRKADLEHEYGFAFVEVHNKRRFDYHGIAAAKNGNFNYLREYYKGGEVYDQQPEAVVWGDLHVGDTCPKALALSIKQLEELRPKRVVLHDVFNAHSINHHEKRNHLSKARLWRDKMSVLEEEVIECSNVLNDIATRFPDIEFLVSESNHDLFLAKYIGEENFLEDGQNSVFACQMFVNVVDGVKQPILKTAFELVGVVPANLRFLNEDEEYRVRGTGLDYHGHRGINGARGTSASFSNHNLEMITAHEHNPKIHPKGMVVGTMTHLRLGYTKGAGNWMHANGILYNSGKRALLLIIH